jgi:hypothetical protein
MTSASLARIRAAIAGTRRAHHQGMRFGPDPSWTVPFHVLMWTVLSVGLIMVMVVYLMR